MEAGESLCREDVAVSHKFGLGLNKVKVVSMVFWTSLAMELAPLCNFSYSTLQQMAVLHKEGRR